MRFEASGGDRLRVPYYRCMKCEIDVQETRFPLRGSDRVPLCSGCESSDDIDIVLGDENTELDAETVIYFDEEE